MNLLDLALDFQNNATIEHYEEFFGDDVALQWMYIVKTKGIMKVYGGDEYNFGMDDDTKRRFVTYLTNRWALIPNPDVE